jgi:alcohol dehydrogenase class IV
VSIARHTRCDVVVGLGGGSAIDGAKAVAAMLPNPGDVLDYVEVIGGGRPIAHAPAPCIAIPTTAGTGSEATRNSVLASHEHRVKVSLRSPLMLPRVAIVDPALSSDLPPALTATTGLDALTQLIEGYVSRRANPMTDALALAGIRYAAEALPAAWQNGCDDGARDQMAMASLLSGIVLANAGLGAVHGFAGPIGGRFNAPHGAICAALLPHVMAANLRALEARGAADPALAKLGELGRLLTGRTNATAADGVAWVREHVAEFGIPSLSHYGLVTDATDEIVAGAMRASSMKGNPIELTEGDLRAVLTAACQS